MTTWTLFCPFLTTTYLYMDIFNPVMFWTTYLPPLLVHVVIECPLVSVGLKSILRLVYF